MNIINDTIEIHGSLFLAFIHAGESLRLILRGEVMQLESFEPDTWYPLEKFQKLLQAASEYKNHSCILEQIGIEMMLGWYHHGPGKNIISSGIDFLYFQSSSEGYRSVVKGPAECTGSFELLELNETGGTAKIYSTTVFPRSLEIGIILGGLGLAGDMLYYDVRTSSNPSHFDICFVTQQNLSTLSWHQGDAPEALEWRFNHYKSQTAEKEKFWSSINETLHAAYAELQNAVYEVKILSGLLPICASCKKIRDDKGYWNQIETFIQNHSEAEFTHGICPDCAQKLYPEFKLNACKDTNT